MHYVAVAVVVLETLTMVSTGADEVTAFVIELDLVVTVVTALPINK
jgi:hypothetical protein